MEYCELLALAFVGDAGHSECLRVTACGLMERFLDPAVWYHFAADFRRTGESVGNPKEAVFVFDRHVTRDIPPVLQDRGSDLPFAASWAGGKVQDSCLDLRASACVI